MCWACQTLEARCEAAPITHLTPAHAVLSLPSAAAVAATRPLFPPCRQAPPGAFRLNSGLHQRQCLAGTQEQKHDLPGVVSPSWRPLALPDMRSAASQSIHTASCWRHC